MTAVGGTIVAPSSPSLAQFHCHRVTTIIDPEQPNRQSPVRHTHLCQSGLLVADFVFADGRQLLQRVAVVGERPRQPSELGPSCRNQTSDTASVRIWWELGGRQRNTTPKKKTQKKKTHNQAPVSRDGEELQNIPTAFTYCFA